MFVKRKKNRSGTTSIVVAEKSKGSYRELRTIGIAHNEEEAASLVLQGREWIMRNHPKQGDFNAQKKSQARESEIFCSCEEAAP